MKIITWLKSLSWIVILGAIGTAIIMVLNAFRAGKMEADVKHQEADLDRLNQDTKVEIAAATKLQDSIAKKKVKAREVRKKSEASLERIGQHETMADIADRLNSKSGRVRSRTDSAPKI